MDEEGDVSVGGGSVVKRGVSQSTPKFQRYLVKGKNFQRQYTHIYQKRLMQLRGGMLTVLKSRNADVGAWCTAAFETPSPHAHRLPSATPPGAQSRGPSPLWIASSPSSQAGRLPWSARCSRT